MFSDYLIFLLFLPGPPIYGIVPPILRMSASPQLIVQVDFLRSFLSEGKLTGMESYGETLS